MPGPALRRQPHPQQALLGGLDQVEPTFSAVATGHGDRETAHLADGLADTGEKIGPIPNQPVCPVLAATLLVGDEREHQIPGRHDGGPLEVTRDGQHHPAHVLHIDRPASPHVAIRHRTRERVNAPIGGHGGHHVEVTVNQQCPARGVGARQPDEDVAAAGSARLQVLRGVAHLAELLGNPVGALRLTLSRLQLAGVRGVEPDQRADQTHYLVLGICHGCINTTRGALVTVQQLDTTSLSRTPFTTRVSWGSIYR